MSYYARCEGKNLNLSEDWARRNILPSIKIRQTQAWHSKKSPYYGSRSIYSACHDLLSLPPEVYGTGGSSEGDERTAAIKRCVAGAPVGGVESWLAKMKFTPVGILASCATGIYQPVINAAIEAIVR